MEFLVVCDVNKVSEDICDELNSVPVVLQHVTSAKKKNAADEKLRQVRRYRLLVVLVFWYKLAIFGWDSRVS